MAFYLQESPDSPWNISLQLFLFIYVLPVTDMIISCFSIVLGALLIIYGLYIHKTTTHSLIVDEQEENSFNTKDFKQLPIETMKSQHVSKSNAYGNATDNSSSKVLLMTKNNDSWKIQIQDLLDIIRWKTNGTTLLRLEKYGICYTPCLGSLIMNPNIEYHLRLAWQNYEHSN